MLIRAHHPRCLVSCIPHPRLLSQKLYNNRDKSPRTSHAPYLRQHLFAHRALSLSRIPITRAYLRQYEHLFSLLMHCLSIALAYHAVPSPAHNSRPKSAPHINRAYCYCLCTESNRVLAWCGCVLDIVPCYVRSVNYCSACVVARCARFAPCFLYVIAPYCHVGTIYQSHW